MRTIIQDGLILLAGTVLFCAVVYDTGKLPEPQAIVRTAGR